MFWAPPGHTFLTLTKSNGSQSITQSIGFYPSTSSTITPGCFKDNGTPNNPHEYNASLTINNAPKSAFDNVVQVLLTHQHDTYNLYTNNCTNVALNAFNSIISPPIVTGLTEVYFPVNPPVNVAYIFAAPTALYRAIGQFTATTQITKQFRVKLDAPTSHGPCN